MNHYFRNLPLPHVTDFWMASFVTGPKWLCIRSVLNIENGDGCAPKSVLYSTANFFVLVDIVIVQSERRTKRLSYDWIR